MKKDEQYFVRKKIYDSAIKSIIAHNVLCDKVYDLFDTGGKFEILMEDIYDELEDIIFETLYGSKSTVEVEDVTISCICFREGEENQFFLNRDTIYDVLSNLHRLDDNASNILWDAAFNEDTKALENLIEEVVML